MGITAQALRVQRVVRNLPEVKAPRRVERVWIMVAVISLVAIATVIVLARLGLFPWQGAMLAPTPVPGPLGS